VCVGGNQSGIYLVTLATMCIGIMHSSILHLFSGSDVENREVDFMKQ
jgi:acyl-coenzyme A synthetase/AMP-(fatty) acid ligase